MWPRNVCVIHLIQVNHAFTPFSYYIVNCRLTEIVLQIYISLNNIPLYHFLLPNAFQIVLLKCCSLAVNVKVRCIHNIRGKRAKTIQ